MACRWQSVNLSPKEALMALPGSGAEMQRSAKDKLMRDLEGTIAKMST